MSKDEHIFYDADVLSSFLNIGESDFLFNIFSKIIILEPVYNELTNMKTPELVRNKVNELVDRKLIEIIEIEVQSKTYAYFNSIENGEYSDGKVLGKGESATLAKAICAKGVVASNNLSDVAQVVKKFELPFLTSSLILAQSFDNGIVNKEQVENIWGKMLDKNISLPNSSFFDYYKKTYELDKKEFNVFLI